MKSIVYKHNIPSKFIKKKIVGFEKLFKNNFDLILNNIDKETNTFHILSKKYNFNFIKKELNKFKKFKQIAIIGMGGSILGSEAIHDFLKHKIKKKIFFIDNLDSEKLSLLSKKNLNKILFIVISKSGETIETISSLFFLKILKKNAKNLILIAEKTNNTLHSLSRKLNLYFVEHKKYIGGRYSVLSEVGILPSYLFGLNIKEMRKNIREHLKSYKINFLKESVLTLSSLLKNSNKKNIVFLNYSSKLNKFLFWYQQLIAESLGKNENGFFPVISETPKDHHSLLQLYLDGPKDKIFYIFSIKEKKTSSLKINNLTKKSNFLHNRHLNEIKIAQKEALIKSLKKKNIPFREIVINVTDEKTIGRLFSYFMLETAMIGKILKINPFDQPAVEEVKNFTRSILK
tara:strand:+ start:849 stop:2054 length:1206 start_codon:yes stop_codon:yes gene_type:complete